MNFASLILQYGPILAVSAGIAAASLFIWWLIRKRQKRVWLPTVRILDLDHDKLPKLTIKPPPLVAFLCFLISALGLVFFTAQPKEQVFTPYEPNQTRVHLFFDMSPSISAYVDIERYGTEAQNLFSSLQPLGRITVSTSHSNEILEPKSGAEVQTLVGSAGFHRAGLRLGEALKMVIAEAGEVDRLFIVTDRDVHSWQDFNWTYLQEDMDVLFVNVEDFEPRPTDNVFVHQLSFVSQPTSTSMDWEVELRRSDIGQGELSGKVTVSLRDQLLHEEPFTFAADSSSALVRMSWPARKSDELIVAGVYDPLVFRLVGIADSIAADNEFRTSVRGQKLDAIVVSPPTGERMLEDPAHDLQVALEVLGFRVHRYDRIEQPGPEPSRYALWVIMAGGGEDLTTYCPKSLAAYRLGYEEEQGARALTASPPKVFLSPQFVEADYAGLCACYSLLLKNESVDAQVPGYCEGVESRNHWIGLLPSLGAKQIGGEISDVTGSLAFLGSNRASGLEVLAFTLPLRPSPSSGLSHAYMPILLKQLLSWQDLLNTEEGLAKGEWPRPLDVTKSLWNEGSSPDERAKILAANVPIGESLLQSLEQGLLPPRWTSQVELTDNKLPMKKDRDDPLPWLFLIAMTVSAALFVESFFHLAAFLRRMLGKRREAAVLLALTFCGVMADEAPAQVDLALFNYPKMTMNALSREVRHRTSIELSTAPINLSSVDDKLLLSPWLWTKSLEKLSDSRQQINENMRRWLVRGGILVIEGNHSPEALQRFTQPLSEAPSQPGRWQPIPPDHELMRSFYLLDGLPVCQSQAWQGFLFDDRLAIVVIPFPFLAALSDDTRNNPCPEVVLTEQTTRAFVNLLMVALATDYKKDQIHLPEILKRLR